MGVAHAQCGRFQEPFQQKNGHSLGPGKESLELEKQTSLFNRRAASLNHKPRKCRVKRVAFVAQVGPGAQILGRERQMTDCKYIAESGCGWSSDVPIPPNVMHVSRLQVKPLDKLQSNASESVWSVCSAMNSKMFAPRLI